VEVDMRKLIAGAKISVDGKIEGPEGYADWVEAPKRNVYVLGFPATKINMEANRHKARKTGCRSHGEMKSEIDDRGQTQEPEVHC
jgi:hypothetical protein